MNSTQNAQARRTPSWRQLSPRRHRDAILCLHDVRDRDWLHRFMCDLTRRASVVGLASLLDGPRSSAWADPRVAVTFDDGYKSIRTIVEPEFSHLNLPFTTFVCGEVLQGGPAPWYERVRLLLDRFGAAWAAKYWDLDGVSSKGLLSALKEAPTAVVLKGLGAAEADAKIPSRALCSRFMTVSDLSVVARNPLVTVGSHTYSHPILANLSPSGQREEILRGLVALRDACSSTIEFFAYPNGKAEDFDDGVVQVLREAGLRAAFTTAQRPLQPTDDPMRLPRIGISEGDAIEKLELKWALPWLSVGELRESMWRRRYRGSWSDSD